MSLRRDQRGSLSLEENNIWGNPFLVCVSSGIPAMVDLAAMRDAVAKHGVDPSLVNPKCPTDLVVDHSLQIDYSKWLVCGFIFSFDKAMFITVLFTLQCNPEYSKPWWGGWSQSQSASFPTCPLRAPDQRIPV